MHNTNEPLFYHQRLPRRIWSDLLKAGLSESLIHRRLIGWDGERITVPLFREDRRFAFFTYLTDPLAAGGIAMAAEARYTPAQLYGWDTLNAHPYRVFVASSPWERLLLEGRGFPAVGIVGDSFAFKEQWGAWFQGSKEVYLAFPSTGAGHRAARRVASVVPHARVVPFSEAEGIRGVESFFLEWNRTPEELTALLPRIHG